MARSRTQPAWIPLAGMALALCAGQGHAALAERCAWPPPGGPAFRPDSIHAEVAPLVGDLDGDGMPEIVFLSFSNGTGDNFGRDGVLRILSGADCSEIAAVEDVGCVSCFGDAACASLETNGGPGIFCPACTPAIADLDGDGLMEIVALTETGSAGGVGRRAVVLDHAGNFLRCAQASAQFIGNVAAVALADLEADGSAEILARGVAWRGSGELLWDNPLSGVGANLAADLDGDGLLEVTTGQVTYRADGSTLWANPDLGGAAPAVADFDLDCVPDLVVTSRNNQTVNLVDALTGAVRASAPIPAADCPPRPDGQGGPPTLGDVDGDCIPEIGVAGCRRYVMYRYAPGPPEQLVQAWESPVDDATSRFTGSAIFDLEADGTAEVLYNDQQFFRIFNAVTGAVLASLPNSTNTLLEFPVVADADADGSADILLSANAYASCCETGIRVLWDDAVPWAPVRPLFNQHSYHVTNILDDGTLPAPEERSWSRFNTFRVQGEPLRDDLAGPEISGAPPDVSIACGPVPPPAAPSAIGGCDETPAVSLTEVRTDGACPQAYLLTRTWTTMDRCGRSASAVQVVTMTDEVPPALLGVPPDAEVACAEPPAAPVTASDSCDPGPAVTLVETVEPGPCPQRYRVLRTWEARDACGNATTDSQVVTVTDDAPPVLSGVPADVTATCEAPPPASVGASDACDPLPAVVLTERVIPGPCPHEFSLERRWEARDACGNAASATQVVTVVDDGPPRLAGVPGDAVEDCASVPPPADVTAEDGCDPVVPVVVTEERIDGPCPSTYRLVRTWRAVDSCGRVAEARQIVDVVDRTPPVITSPPERACLWPPNHWLVCFSPETFHPVIIDDCPGEVTWRFAGCVSDQPENDLGDGDTAPDCILRDDGTVCVRAERQGIDPEGRHYGLLAVAVDACGNASLPAAIADIYVPHDQAPHEDCLKTTVVGENDRGRRP